MKLGVDLDASLVEVFDRLVFFARSVFTGLLVLLFEVFESVFFTGFFVMISCGLLRIGWIGVQFELDFLFALHVGLKKPKKRPFVRVSSGISCHCPRNGGAATPETSLSGR